MAKRKTLYAQTHLEHEDEHYSPGDEVPADLPGIEELKDQGAVSEEAPVIEKQAGDEGGSSDGSG